MPVERKLHLSISQTPSTVKAPEPPESPRLAYWGKMGEAWRLAIRTTLLTILTLGVYRFWAKTEVRRYFWSRITVNDEPLEYVGTGLELFIGFLIVMLILTPIYGAIALGQMIFPLDSPMFALSQSGPALLILALIPLAIFRARRYRLSRTVWRGVRAGQTGTGRGYWIRAVWYGGIALLTLGLLRPLAQTRLTAYLMNNTWVGQQKFTFQMRARRLLWRWLVFWLCLATAYGGTFLGIFLLVKRAELTSGDETQLPDIIGNASSVEPVFVGVVIVGWLLLSLLAGVAYIWYRLAQVRLFTAATTLADLRFKSSIRIGRVVGIYLLAALAYAGLLFGSAAISFPLLGEQFWFVGVVLAGFVAGTLFIPFVTHPLLRHYVETLEIDGAFDPDALLQNDATSPKTGEGLASVFDVDAF